MATELDKLVVKIEADLSDLKKKMAQADKIVGNSSKKMSGGLTKVSNSLSRISKTALKVGGVLGVAFGAVFIKGVIDTGIQIENLQIRLKALFGSAEEGTKAFDAMLEFAGKVPFTLGEIQQASGNLAVVAKDAKELANVLKITGNVAAVTGLDFQQTAEQIQRSFSGGIASADIFRERGVRDLLGFSAGATVSAEETKKAFQKVFGVGGEFGNITDELANTLTGTISMIKDKFMQFQIAVSESFFAELKAQFGNLNEFLDENNQKIKELGRSVGEGLAKTVKFLVENIQGIKNFFIAFAGASVINAIARLKASFVALNLVMLLNPITGPIMLGIASGVAISAGIIFLIEKFKDMSDITRILTDDMKKQNDIMLEGIKLRNEMAEVTKKQQLEDALFKLFPESFPERNAEALAEEARKKRTKEQIKLDLIASRGMSDQARDMQLLKEMNEAYAQQLKNLAIIEEVNNEARGKQFEKEMESIATLHKEFEIIGQSISTAFGEAVISGKDFKDSMVDIFQSVAQQVVGLIFHLRVMKPLLDSIRQADESSRISGGSFFSNLFSAGSTGSLTNTDMIMGGVNGASMPMQGLAGGGSVNPNMPYMVGERGAEMFVPKSAGNIVNSNNLASMGGGSSIVIEQNLNFATGVSQTVRAEVMNLLPAIQQSTLSAVQDARLRGGTFAKDFGA
tara:strand:+ start:639 stop:2690 length:2052 start_codon:yes stop_codon:yes gene_type:complete